MRKQQQVLRVVGLCLAILATWQAEASAASPCKFSKGSATYGANGTSAALIANGSVSVSTPAVYKTKYTVDVGIWVDADLAALDPDMPELALAYYEHANCIFALGNNANSSTDIHDMSLRIAGNRIRYFNRTSPKIPGTGAYWELQTHQDWSDAIQALGVAAPKVNLLFTAGAYVTIGSLNPDGSIASWTGIGGASNGVGQGQALAAVNPSAYKNGGKPFNEDWWGVIAAHELGHALGVNGHVAMKLDTMCCGSGVSYAAEPGNTESYRFSMSQGTWNTTVALDAASGDNYTDPYAIVPNPLTNEIWSFSQIHDFLIPYNFEDAIIWRYTGVPCSGGSCTGWQALDDKTDTVAVAAGDDRLYQLRDGGAIWRYTGVPCSGITCTGWQLVDNNFQTKAIAAAGTELYQLHESGAIWRYTGTPCTSNGCPGWQKLDQNAATKSIVAAGANLYQLHGNGSVWRYTGAPCSGSACPGWQKLDANSGTKTIAAGGSDLYQLRTNGSILRYTGVACSGLVCPGWQKLDQNLVAAIAAGGGALYQLHTNGSIWRYTGTPCTSTACPGWQKLDQNLVDAIAVSSSGALFQLHTDGSIWRYTGTPCSSNGCPGWQKLDHNARTTSISAASFLYQVH